MMFHLLNLKYSVLMLMESAICIFGVEVPLIQLKTGTIEGFKVFNDDYYMYLGIPYAKVDDSDRFGPSIPYTINSTFKAYDDSALCPQVNQYNNKIMGTIDCLRLNVYVPTSERTSDVLFPVMIWIYGGGFYSGFAARYVFGPSYLVQHDVILVTINYRTGPYGFMCLDIPEVSGNQGLKDQYLAIKWVKDNIEAFGGNPGQITVFGQSAGGHSIDLHLMSTKEILFNKIILQSGSAQSLTVFNEPDKLAPLEIARYIGLQTNDIGEALSFLSKTDTNLVITAVTKLNIQFKPCVETIFDNVEPFISNSWVNAEVPKVKDMPVMMGFNKLEMAKLFKEDDNFFNNLTIVRDSLKQVFDFDGQVIQTLEFVSHYYFGDEKRGNCMKGEVIRFASDFTYIHPVHRTLQKYIDNKASNIYFYMFSYVGGRNLIRTNSYDEIDSRENKLCCAAHKDDVGYLFSTSTLPPLTKRDQIVMKRMTKMWTNFAKYSDPTPEISELLPLRWIPVNETYNYMNIDIELTLGKRPLHKRMAFWDLFYTHNKISQKWYEE